MTDDLVWDKEKGELRILGRRQTAMTPQTLCNHLDSLVGIKVAEVIVSNLEYRSGKDETEMFRKEKPQATLSEMVDLLVRYDSLTGVGITKVTLPKNDQDHIIVQISNPSVKGTVGAAKAFLFSYWCGALTTLLNRNLEIEDVAYDEKKNVMTCNIVLRLSK
jgi:hypothetical protein